MARRSRYRNGSAADAAPSKPIRRSTDVILEDISHELKLIDIKRRAIRETSARLPWFYGIAGVLGLLLLGAILGISVLGIFIFGALFSGALANIVGPTGARTARQRAYQEIGKGKERLLPMLLDVPENVDPVIFGVTRITKTDIQLADKFIKFRDMHERNVNEQGAFDFGSYRYLGFVFRGSDGKIDVNHAAIRKQYWLTDAKRRNLNDDVIIGAVERLLSSSRLSPIASPGLASAPA